MTTASGDVLLLTDPDVDVLAYQFLDSDYAAGAYIDWPLEQRLEGFLRNRGMSRVADDGDTCHILLDRVMSYINVVSATRVKAKTSQAEGLSVPVDGSRASSADDARGIHDRLVESGVHITRPPSTGPFGLPFSFVDPDGYPITIHQPS